MKPEPENAEQLTEYLARMEPEVSRVLWKNFACGTPTALSKPLQDAKKITRQAASLLLTRLVRQRILKDIAGTRPRLYEQPVLLAHSVTLPLEGLEEHVVWSQQFQPVFSRYMGSEALGIMEYGFTEMLNNARDHSQGSAVTISAQVRPGSTQVQIEDNGEGIFERISRLRNLPDQRQAILELAKGKLTTDPANHTGEGVFFSTHAFDVFQIISGDLVFDHKAGEKNFLSESRRDTKKAGTLVVMEHGNHTPRLLRNIFDEFAAPDEYAFNKTVVPVELARLGQEGLVSRSQAQRLLTRLDKFETVLFDFAGIESVGQAFADEIFRVYANAHPDIELIPIHASSQVQQMIARATALH